MVAPLEPTFVHLASQAEALAARRQEPLRGVHLLAAAGAVSGGVRDVLEDAHAGFRRVLDQWERQAECGEVENLQLLRRRVGKIAKTFGSRSPDAGHLLLALLDDTRGSARRILEELKVDVHALRGRAMQISQGLPMRSSSRVPVGHAPPSEMVARPRGQVLPVMPKGPVVAAQNSTPGGTSAVGTSQQGRLRPTGQALSVIPQVGPTPLPGKRVRGDQRGGSPDASDPPRGLEEALSSALDDSSGCNGDSLRAGDDCGTSAEDLRELSATEKAEANQKYALDAKLFPILTKVGRNLTLAAALGDGDPVVGRQAEIEDALDVLAKRHGNNPCLIGEAGVGKSSVARGIAASMSAHCSDDRVVIEIPISELVAGTATRGSLSARLNALKKEVTAAGARVVLFFDEIHQLFSGDLAEEAASDLKLSLARGELPCIGATTTQEYRRVIESDPTLSRRFSPIEIEEPERDEAFLILSGLASRLARHHQVLYNDESLAMSIAWSIRYLPGRCLPDKAVGVLDLAGARSRRRGRPEVGIEAVAEVIASQANMPVERLLESDAERMLQLDQLLCERVVGHEDHLVSMARILRRNAAGLGTRRPIGTFLLLGPTGVGKTETAKAIAESLFHSEGAMTRIDMAEYSEAHAVAKLVGAPPGYVGHDAGGQLTEAVRRRPYQVVLLDEIEKAHPDVLTAFLGVFDEGRMTDSRGRLVDFTHTVLVLTSNLGSREFTQSARKRVGFSAGGTKTDDKTAVVIAAARSALPPELYNRIDEVLPFSPLTRLDVMQIGRKLCQGLADELELSRGISLAIHDSAIEVLLDMGGYEAALGARPLRRMIARQIEAPLAEVILSDELRSGDTWQISGAEGQLSYSVIASRGSDAAE